MVAFWGICFLFVIFTASSVTYCANKSYKTLNSLIIWSVVALPSYDLWHYTWGYSPLFPLICVIWLIFHFYWHLISKTCDKNHIIWQNVKHFHIICINFWYESYDSLNLFLKLFLRLLNKIEVSLPLTFNHISCVLFTLFGWLRIRLSSDEPNPQIVFRFAALPHGCHLL